MQTKPVVVTTAHTFTFSDTEAAQLYWDIKYMIDWINSNHLTPPGSNKLLEFYQLLSEIKTQRIRDTGRWD